MWLKGENGHPEVERYDKNDRPEQSLFSRRMRAEGVLQEQQWPHSNGKQIPYVKVQQQVTRVEIPWLGSKDVGPSIASAEDVVKNDPQWHHDKVMVEENVHGELESLMLSVKDQRYTAVPYQSNQRPHSAIQESSEGVVTLTGENTKKDFFQDERSYQYTRERPPNNGTNTKPHDALSCLRPIPPVHKSRHAQIDRVHGETRRQVSHRRIEHARTERNDHQIDDRNPAIQRTANGRKQARLGHRAHDSQHDPKKVKLQPLRPGQEVAQLGRNGMNDNVEPAPDGEFRRVLPRLESVSMAEVVQGLPVVEHLVAVLDWRVGCGEEVGQ